MGGFCFGMVVQDAFKLKGDLYNSLFKILFNGDLYDITRKEYALWISSAKKPETKERRLAEITGKLLKGKESFRKMNSSKLNLRRVHFRKSHSVGF